MRIFAFGLRGFPFIAGGVERHCEELYSRLADKGHSVTVLSREQKLHHYKGVKFVRLPYINHKYFETLTHSFWCTLYCLLKRPDVVHVHNMGACLGVPLLSMAGLKVVFTMHSLNYEHSKWGRLATWGLHLLECLGYNFSTHTLVVSKYMIPHLKGKYKRNSPIHWIPNGVGKAVHVKAGEMLKLYKLKPKQYVLGVGRLVPEKGWHRLIEAYKSIPDPDYKLVIVGNNVHSTIYKHSLWNERCDSIKLTGAVFGEELSELYSNAGLFVSPSYSEGFPLVVLEAVSYGLPVLLSDIPAHRELSLSRSVYWKYRHELRAKIERGMSGDPIDLSQQKKMLEQYTWEAVVERWIDVVL